MCEGPSSASTFKLPAPLSSSSRDTWRTILSPSSSVVLFTSSNMSSYSSSSSGRRYTNQYGYNRDRDRGRRYNNKGYTSSYSATSRQYSPPRRIRRSPPLRSREGQRDLRETLNNERHGGMEYGGDFPPPPPIPTMGAIGYVPPPTLEDGRLGIAPPLPPPPPMPPPPPIMATGYEMYQQQQHPGYYQYPYMGPPMNGPVPPHVVPHMPVPGPSMPRKRKSEAPDANKVVGEIIAEMKINGLFDQFRKDCLAGVEDTPSFQTLNSKVIGAVDSFLKSQTWSTAFQKVKIRQVMQKQITDQGYYERGIENIVYQAWETKKEGFWTTIEDEVFKKMGLEKKTEEEKAEEGGEGDLPPAAKNEVVSEEDSEDESPMFEMFGEVSPPRPVILENSEEILQELKKQALREAVLARQKKEAGMSAGSSPPTPPGESYIPPLPAFVEAPPPPPTQPELPYRSKFQSTFVPCPQTPPEPSLPEIPLPLPPTFFSKPPLPLIPLPPLPPYPVTPPEPPLPETPPLPSSPKTPEGPPPPGTSPIPPSPQTPPEPEPPGDTSPEHLLQISPKTPEEPPPDTPPEYCPQACPKTPEHVDLPETPPDPSPPMSPKTPPEPPPDTPPLPMSPRTPPESQNPPSPPSPKTPTDSSSETSPPKSLGTPPCDDDEPQTPDDDHSPEPPPQTAPETPQPHTPSDPYPRTPEDSPPPDSSPQSSPGVTESENPDQEPRTPELPGSPEGSSRASLDRLASRPLIEEDNDCKYLEPIPSFDEKLTYYRTLPDLV